MRHTGRVVPAGCGVAALGRKGQVILVGEQAPGGRRFARRRRANVEGGRRHEHKVKVTPEEEGVLMRLAEAQHVTVPRLLVESALASESSETPTERRNAMAELFAVHRLLAAVSNNVNQIARATNATGEVQAETAVTLTKVRDVAGRIDAAIDGLSRP
ncbi:plasmid mobilization relaxosome protein MobC [Arthrobacter liuii]|uniref:plasmid mobilization relaxosome protein MobC n=1 Tax=Arthrobacter liuii TaxID=1476996 RepID=UPI0035E6ED19